MADIFVAAGTALKTKLNKNSAGIVLPAGTAKKRKIGTHLDSAPYVGTLVQEYAALSYNERKKAV